MLFTGEEIVQELIRSGITHAIWLPDSSIGCWESSLESSTQLQLIRVCREGEAWPLAAGLQLGGKTPIVIMQTTGLFESGDAMRNVLFDLKLPIVSIIGARNWLDMHSKDTAKQFTQPILKAWNLNCQWVANEEDKPLLAGLIQRCLQMHEPGAVLLAE